ncbi:MAG: alanine--tRNA ligase [Candidatus Omnitrophica bacterium]|nr:alanine--tRNA ligase [Candidatus Omnitrophota bacterium]
MTSNEIRKIFLDFFQKKDHKVIESDLLVPREDPTLLFTGAGMNQFKEQFMGNNITFKRATTCQKCIRTGDIENVGKTPRHHTFFEMLGNFSFGDYFKAEAIEWGWDFMTRLMGLDKEKLWVSVYKEDDEAYDIWINKIGISKEKIVRLGEHDNFWPADAPSKGPNGPCGPCSEIFYDWGKNAACDNDNCNPACDCGRFLEVWNLVFTEFERKDGGKLVPLPNKNIDTGMGLERITAVVKGYKENKVNVSNFDTDAFGPIIKAIKDTGISTSIQSEVFLIADHIRTITFAICDGVSPSNEKQGYVIRKLIRRAYMKGSGGGPFLYKIVPVVCDLMKHVYPELDGKEEHISAIVKMEEERFDLTIKTAKPFLEEILKAKPQMIQGKDIFKLVDTFGLPLDVIKDESEAIGISLDIIGFEKLMDGRKEESRKGSNIVTDSIFHQSKFSSAIVPEFSDMIPLTAEIVFIVKDNDIVNKLSQGDEAQIIISPQSSYLYAEGGGQKGDKGTLSMGENIMELVNVYDADKKRIMNVKVIKGTFTLGDKVKLTPDNKRKKNTAMNHTATHLLQAALREVLGEHVKQSGSFVDDTRLRFDFTHIKKVTDLEMLKVEKLVNSWINKKIEVIKKEKTIEEAKEEGALSFFGEKYGDVVRVVSVDSVSKEFCGGSHVDNTGEIELFLMINEGSVASGIRRIEALTGNNAIDHIRVKIASAVKDFSDAVNEIKIFCDNEGVDFNQLRSTDQELINKLDDLANESVGLIEFYQNNVKNFIAEVNRIITESKKLKDRSDMDLVFNEFKQECDNDIKLLKNEGSKCYAKIISCQDMKVLKKIMMYAENKIASGVIVFGNDFDGKATLLCSVTPDMQGLISANDVIKNVSPIIQGGGGGNNSFAQAGGKKVDKLNEAVLAASEFVRNKITKI